MNKVDQEVRRMMLRYPGIFPNRISCLEHLFLVGGNGYRWTESGELRSMDDERDINKMSYNDLDQRLQTMRESQVKYNYTEDDEISRFRIAEVEQERMNRQFRERHIDLFCQFNNMHDALTFERVQHVNLLYTQFADAPYGSIDPDWLKAAEEIIRELMMFFNRTWNVNEDIPAPGKTVPNPSMYSRMPDRFQNLYTQAQEISAKLDAQSGSKARLAEMYKLVLAAFDKPLDSFEK